MRCHLYQTVSKFFPIEYAKDLVGSDDALLIVLVVIVLQELVQGRAMRGSVSNHLVVLIISLLLSISAARGQHDDQGEERPAYSMRA